MALSPDICIRGAGIVGRTLALLLARERLRVALVSPPNDPASGHGDVRAYALSPSSRTLLESLRCWPSEREATPVLAMHVQGDQQGHVEFSASSQGVDALNWIVDVPSLESKLAEAVRYQSGIEEIHAPVAAPLTVVCEGRSSQTRADLGVEFESTSYPQQAIATRLECEYPHTQIARQWFTPTGEILALLPLGGPQGKEVAVVWAVRKERVSELISIDSGAFAAKLAEASQHALGAVAMTAERATWPLTLARATRWVGSVPDRTGESFALAGDAAHTMHPLAGQGLNVGLGDVRELAQVLADREVWRTPGDLRLLRRYERARQAEWLRMSTATDVLQQLFNRPEALLSMARNWGMMAFDYSGPLKSLVARVAMGTSAP